jgi:hypothetical protein
MRRSLMRAAGAVIVLAVGAAVFVAMPRFIGLGAGPTASDPPPFTCPSSQSAFLTSVCNLSSSSAGWRGISVSSSDVGPTPAMYARLARAVAAGDDSICDDDKTVMFIQYGSHVGKDTAHQICVTYIDDHIALGWFEVSDPATAETIRIDMPQ